MMRTTKVQKAILWLMIALMLITNIDFSIFAKESSDPIQNSEIQKQKGSSRNGRVFEDSNHNGKWDEEEPGIAGVRVRAISNSSSAHQMEVVTNNEGVFLLEGLENETYHVLFYAEPETTAPYNMTDSIARVSEKVKLPQENDDWMLQYPSVASDSEEELQLGLQKDDVNQIDQEIEEKSKQVENQLNEEQPATVAGVYATAKATVQVWMDYRIYKGKHVTVSYTLGGKKHSNADYIWIYLVGSSQSLYCLQPGVTLKSGDIMNPGSGSLKKLFDNSTAVYLQRVAYYGCDYQGWGKLSSDEKNLYSMAAQSLIWENRGVTNISWSMQDGNNTKIIIKEYKNRIKEKLENHEKKASFAGTTQTVTRSATDPNKEFTFQDTNQMLSKSTITGKSAGIKSAVIQGNKLTIVLKDTGKYDGTTQTIDFQKAFPTSFGNQYYTSNIGRQTIFYYGNPTPRTYSFNIQIQAKGNLRIRKVDDTGTPVAGVSFKYGTSSSQLNSTTAKTNTAGVADLNNIAAGTTIYVQEFEVPSHLVKSTEIKSAKVKASQTVIIDYRNDRIRKNVLLRKVNAETKQPIAGATFSYTDGNSTYQSVTNTNGEFTSAVTFPVGTKITMTEISPGPGYMIPEGAARVQTKTLSLNDTENIFTFENTPKKVSLSIMKYNSRTKLAVQGVTFKVGPDVNGIEGTAAGYDLLTTNSSGKVTSRAYDARSTIYYQEVDGPSNIALDRTIKKVVFLDESLTVSVFNEEASVKLRVMKTGDDKTPLKGVDFDIEEYAASSNTWQKKESITTKTDGTADSVKTYSREAIAKGYLRLVETNVVKGYKKLSHPIVLASSMAAVEKDRIDISVTNEKIPTKLFIYKYDKESRIPLSGAEFKITDAAGNTMENLVTNSKGEAVTETLLSDTVYYLEETAAPKGYKKALNGKQRFVITDNGNGVYEKRIEIANNPIYGYIEVQKTDNKSRPLNGIEFTVYKGSQSVETLITDRDGYAKSDKLLADAPYTVKETYAPPQYVTLLNTELVIDFLNPPQNTITGTGYTALFNQTSMTMKYQIKNEEKLGDVTITKVDAEDSSIKVKGATFRLYNYISGELIGEKSTNGNGIATFTNVPLVNPTVNSEQGYYVIEEITAGENHVLPEQTKKYFSLTHSDLHFQTTFKNPPVKGCVEIKKVDAEDSNMTLQDAQFVLYKADNLSTSIKTGKTDAKGILRFDNLRYGEYVLKETKASKYHYIDQVNGGNDKYYDKTIKGYRFTISNNAEVIPLTITNPRLKAQIKIIKKDDVGHFLKGAKFNIISESGELLETMTTDDRGEASSSVLNSEDIGDGAYIVEAEKLIGYEENTTHYPIVLSTNSTVQIQMVSQTIINTPEIPSMKIHKTDEDGKPVRAIFRVEAIIQYQNPTVEVFETTADNPTINLESYLQKVINNMTDSFAHIRITEVNTDDPYIKETMQIEFTLQYNEQKYSIEPIYQEAWNDNISFDDNTLTLSVINEKIPIKLKLIKKASASNTYLADAEFKITPNGTGSEPIIVKTTNSADGVTASLPYAESYTVEEVKAPEGYFNSYTTTTYKLSDFTASQTNGVITAYDKELTITNYKMPSLKIRKIGSDGKPLDASFQAVDRPFGAILLQKIETSKENNGYGTLDLSQLFELSSAAKSGTIYISEVSVSGNYELYKSTIMGKYSIELGKMQLDFSEAANSDINVTQSSDGSEVTLTVINQRKDFDFKMQKKGVGSDQPTATITMSAYKKGSATLEKRSTYFLTSISLTSVKAFFTQLSEEVGYDIYINETKTSEGYKLLPEFKAFTYYPDNEGKEKFKDVDKHIALSQSGKTFQIDLKNERMYSLHLYKLDTQNAVANAHFKVTASDGTGTAIEKNIQTVNGDADLTPFLQELYEKNSIASWSIIVQELETEDGLQRLTGQLMELNFNPVYLGSDPHSFLLFNHNNYPDQISGLYNDIDNQYSTSINIKNKNIPVNFKLLKKDSKHSNQYLAGAIFEIKPEGKTALQVTTSGTAGGDQVQLPYAKSYTVREVKAPTGYVMDTSVYQYSINDFTKVSSGDVITAYNMTQTYTNDLFMGTFEIAKYDADNPNASREKLNGAVFEIYEGVLPTTGTPEEQYNAVHSDRGYALVDTVTIGSDQDGIGTSKELPYGEYIIKEITPPKDYQISKKLIAKSIMANQVTVHVNIANKLMEGSLHIYKYAGELGKDSETPLAGAVFTIHRTDTDEQVGDKITSDAAGSGGTISLPYGDYYVKEVEFPAGYMSTKGIKHPFSLNGTQSIQSIAIQNTEAAYSFQLYKRDKNTGIRLGHAVFGLFEDGKSPEQLDTAVLTFETNINGTATVMLDQGGDYDIYELQAPDGYERIKDKFEIHVDEQNQTAAITVDNYRKQLTVEINKQDETTNAPLAGAYFEIRNTVSNEVVANAGPTASDGKVSVEVPAGDVSYSVRETVAPSGYVLDDTEYPVLVSTEPEEDGTLHYVAQPVTITNRAVNGNIRLIKVDEDHQEIRLADALFAVYDNTGTEVDRLITNASGEAMSKELPPGTYTVKELAAPTGYELDNVKTYDAVLSTAVKQVTITAVNKKKTGGISLKKVDAMDQSIVLSGAEFQLFETAKDAEKKEHPIQTVVTGSDGIALFTNLAYAKYYAVETKAPSGYERIDYVQELTVDAFSAAADPIVYINYQLPTSASFQVVKRDAQTRAVLQGARFLVEGGPDGTYHEEYVSDGSGKFHTEELPFGEYTVTELQAPEGYKLSQPFQQKVVLNRESIETPILIEFLNDKIEVSIHLLKNDVVNAQPLINAVFDIYELTADGQRKEPAIDRLVSDAFGSAVSGKLPQGRYEIVEVMAPEGYEIVNGSNFITIDQNSENIIELIVQNTPVTGSLEILKTDAETGEPLSGVEFTIYNSDDTVYDKIITNEQGKGVSLNIPYGMYSVKETKVPYGYMHNDAYRDTFTITAQEDRRNISLQVSNQPVKGKIGLYKVDAEQAEIGVGGARYGIYTRVMTIDDGSTVVDTTSYLGESYDLISQNDLLIPEETDDESGEVIPAHYEHQAAISKELSPGTYYLKELSSPTGYELNDEFYTCTLTAEEDYVEITAMDKRISAKVSVHKTDVHSNVPLQGAVFAIYTDTEYDKLINQGDSVQGIDAIYITTDEAGTASTEHLMLNQEYVLVEYKAPDGYEIEHDKVERFTPSLDELSFSYEFTNTKKTEIIVHKVNEEGFPLEGVLFSLYAFGPDQKAETADDIYLDTFSTGYDGQGIARYDSNAMTNGWYYIKETKEPDLGYELSDEIKAFEITDEKHAYEFTYVNHAAKGDIEIWKTDEMENALQGAEFALYTAGDSWFTEENIENNDVFLQNFVMDEGAHAIIHNLPVGCYVIKETQTPPGYKKAEDIFLDMGNGTVENVDGKKHYYVRMHIKNEPIIGHIKIQKQLQEGLELNSELSLRNAQFRILNEQNTLVDTLITDEKGTAVSRELKQGTYTIQETNAPDGTILNNTIGTVTIDGSNTEDIYPYTFTNDLILGQIRIRKIGEQKEALAGAQFDIVNEKGDIVDHLISDVDGEALSKPLSYGWYTIRETKAPDGYVMDPDMKWKVFVQENKQLQELEIMNMKAKQNGVHVIKYDKDHPALQLAGAVFALYAKDDPEHVMQSYTTNEKGAFQIDMLSPGTYVLKEVTAPVGYALDTTPHEFTVEADTNIVLYISNEKSKGRITFDKKGEVLKQVSEDTSYPNLKKLIWETDNIQDAEISIYAKDSVYLDGQAYQSGDFIQSLKSSQTSRYLPAGTYIYRETKTPSSYLPDTQSYEITVKPDETQETASAIAALENKHGSVQLSLHKRFSGSDDSVLYSHVAFGVFTAEDIERDSIVLPQNTLLAVFGIDESGKSKWIKQALPEGRYYVRELETADGYILDTKKYPFTLTYQNENADIVISTQETPVVNESLYGTIRLNKTGDQFTKTQIHKEQEYLVQEPVYEVTQLQSAEVEIRTEQDIVIAGSMYRKGEVVDTLISGKKEESRRLPLGSYTARETKTPVGYLKDEKEYSITLAENELDAHVPVWHQLSIYNRKADVDISIYKKFFNTDNKELFQAVTFGLYAAEDITGTTSAAVLKKDTLLQLLQIAEDGKGSIRRMLPAGRYYIKELTTADGYMLDETSYPFTVEPGSSATIQVGNISQVHPIMNYPQGSLTPFAFRKIDEEENPLQGAVFHLYMCEKTHVHEVQVQNTETDCWQEVDGLSPVTSGADGIVDFGKLPDGDYQLQEAEAPQGYTKPVGQWYLHVENGIEIQGRGASLPPAFAQVDGEVYAYQLVNRRIRELPILGGQGVFLYMGGGSLLYLAAFWLLKKRKGEKDEKKTK